MVWVCGGVLLVGLLCHDGGKCGWRVGNNVVGMVGWVKGIVGLGLGLAGVGGNLVPVNMGHVG